MACCRSVATIHVGVRVVGGMMSLDKAILHGKEKRKPYRGAKAIDPMCRNHGGCPACAKKRQYKIKRREPLEE